MKLHRHGLQRSCPKLFLDFLNHCKELDHRINNLNFHLKFFFFFFHLHFTSKNVKHKQYKSQDFELCKNAKITKLNKIIKKTFTHLVTNRSIIDRQMIDEVQAT